jgi:hypothetical protein
LDFNGICFVTQPPSNVTRTLRRYLKAWVKEGFVEELKLSFHYCRRGQDPEITTLCHEGMIIGRDFYLVPSGKRKPRPRYLYRLESARQASLLAQKESEESNLIRDLWLLVDETGKGKESAIRYAQSLKDLSAMKNLNSYASFFLQQIFLVYTNLLTLMVKCGLKQEENTRTRIRELTGASKQMTEYVRAQKIVEVLQSLPGGLNEKLPATLNEAADSLIRPPMVYAIAGRYLLECSLCAYDNPLSTPLPQKIICKYCSAEFEEALEHQALVRASKEEEPEVKETTNENACIECGSLDLVYDTEREERICRKCATVQPSRQAE